MLRSAAHADADGARGDTSMIWRGPKTVMFWRSTTLMLAAALVLVIAYFGTCNPPGDGQAIAQLGMPTDGSPAPAVEPPATVAPAVAPPAEDPPPPPGASEHIKQVLAGCGDICRDDMTGTPGPYFDSIQKRVNCAALLGNAAIDAPMNETNPPFDLPPELVAAYTYGGRVAVERWWGAPLNNRYLGGNAMTTVWEAAMLDDWAAQCGARKLEGTYGQSQTAGAVDAMQRIPTIKGGRALVIGSEKPWVEACLLSLGAANVTTLEYGKIVSNHPRVHTMTPELARAAGAGLINYFDAIVTFSSLEHSGLGRYGDAMNPWGDRQAAARAWCMMKPGGQAVMGLPVSNDNRDVIWYNAHRLYGPVQLPHMLANWKQVWKAPLLPHPEYPHQMWVVEK